MAARSNLPHRSRKILDSGTMSTTALKYGIYGTPCIACRRHLARQATEGRAARRRSLVEAGRVCPAHEPMTAGTPGGDTDGRCSALLAARGRRRLVPGGAEEAPAAAGHAAVDTAYR